MRTSCGLVLYVMVLPLLIESVWLAPFVEEVFALLSQAVKSTMIMQKKMDRNKATRRNRLLILTELTTIEITLFASDLCFLIP